MSWSGCSPGNSLVNRGDWQLRRTERVIRALFPGGFVARVFYGKASARLSDGDRFFNGRRGKNYRRKITVSEQLGKA
jgi:hypothetical protein